MKPRGLPASRQAATPTCAYDKKQPTRAAELEQALRYEAAATEREAQETLHTGDLWTWDNLVGHVRAIHPNISEDAIATAEHCHRPTKHLAGLHAEAHKPRRWHCGRCGGSLKAGGWGGVTEWRKCSPAERDALLESGFYDLLMDGEQDYWKAPVCIRCLHGSKS